MHYELKQEVYDSLKQICVKTYEKKESIPINEMLMRLMDMEGLPMHCPYHHFIVPAAVLTQTAILEKKDPETLAQWLETAEERGKTVPAGFCGECGTCGSAVGIGLFLSIYTGATPKTTENWRWANEATGKCLQKIALYPGPRCCKRTTFLAMEEAVPYIREKCGIDLNMSEPIICKYHHKNAECLEEQCPFYEEASVR